jgi:hypothetical protein
MTELQRVLDIIKHPPQGCPLELIVLLTSLAIKVDELSKLVRSNETLH